MTRPQRYRTDRLQRFISLALSLCLCMMLVGCWRSSPPEIQEFKAPVKQAVVEAPASQPEGPPAVAAAEPPKPEPVAETSSEPVKAAPTVAVAEAPPPPEPVAEAPKAPSIVGTWTMKSMSHAGQSRDLPAGMEMTWTFTEGGTFTMATSFQGQSQTVDGAYSVDGSQITITMHGQTKTGTITFSGNDQMTLNIEGGEVVFGRT